MPEMHAGRETPAPRTILVRPEIVEELKSILPNQSKEAVMETLGISSNTWTKLKRGMPVREGTGRTVIMRWESIRARGLWRQNGPDSSASR
jgi:hypothetical protein